MSGRNIKREKGVYYLMRDTRNNVDDELKMVVEILEVHTDMIDINRTLFLKLFDHVQVLQKVVLYLLEKRS